MKKGKIKINWKKVIRNIIIITSIIIIAIIFKNRIIELNGIQGLSTIGYFK